MWKWNEMDQFRWIGSVQQGIKDVEALPSARDVVFGGRRWYFLKGEVFFLGFFFFFFGIFFFWSSGPLSSGPLVPWSSGPLVLRSSGPPVPCPPVLWSSGPLVPWSSSSTSVLDNHNNNNNNNNNKNLACNNREQR